MSHKDDLRRAAAQRLLLQGDRCELCEHWERVVGSLPGAPAVGDCTHEWEETLRMATAKACPDFKRDAFVEQLADGSIKFRKGKVSACVKRAETVSI